MTERQTDGERVREKARDRGRDGRLQHEIPVHSYNDDHFVLQWEKPAIVVIIYPTLMDTNKF